MWILFVLTSAVILASRKIQEKKLVGTIGSALGWILRLISAICACIVWIILSRDTIGMTNSTVVSILFVIAILYPLQTHFYYRAMHTMPISTFGMFAGIVPLTSLIGSHIFLDSPISFFGLIAICFTIVSIVIFSYKQQQDDIHISSFFSAIIAYVLFGIGSILDKAALSHIAPIPYTMMNQLIGAISLFLYAYFFLGNTQIQSVQKNIPILLLLGSTMSISWLLATQALTLAPNP